MIFRYSDGSRFEGEWQDAPGYGVQTIAYIDPTSGQPVLRHGGVRQGPGDFYRLDDDGTVVGMDYNSMIDYVVRLGLIKVGSMMGQYEWQKVYQMGKADRDGLRSK